MLLRLMLTVCIWMMAVMPCAWAEENSSSETAISQAETEEMLLKNSPLSKLTIETDEWIERDTYHIRYTFTNPTDEAINETVTRTLIEVHAATNTSLSTSIVKQDPSSEWQLILEPHSSMTHTITFPKEPSYINLFHNQTIFKLLDDNILYYSLRKQDMVPPAKLDIHFDPIALNKGSFTITITNQSPHLLSSIKHFKIHTLTNMKDSFLPHTLASTTTVLPDSISLNLPPNMSKTFHLTTPIPIHLDIPLPPNQSIYSFEINDISYVYFDHKKEYSLYKRDVSYQSAFYRSESSFHALAVKGSMEVVDDSVIYYLTIQNNLPTTNVLRSLDMATEYKDAFNSKKALHYNLSFEKNPIILYPYKKKYYRLILPLLTDTPEQTLQSITAFDKESPASLILAIRPKISADPLHPLQKILYQPMSISSFTVKPYYPYIFSIL